MPDKVVEVPGIGNIAFPDSMSDAEISARISSHVAQVRAASNSGPGSFAAEHGITNPIGAGALDLLQGVGSGALSTLRGASQIAHKVLPSIPEIPQSYGTPPEGLMGSAGKFLEQGAEYGLAGGAARGLGGASDVAKVALNAGTAAGVAGLQSGGDLENMLMAGALGSVTPTAGAGAGLKGAVQGAFDADPKVAMARALSPSPTNTRFADMLPGAMADIKAAGGGNIMGLEHMRQAGTIAMNRLNQGLEKWMEPAREAGLRISGKDIIGATEAAIPDSMRLENPGAAKDLMQSVKRGYGKNFSVDQLKKLLEEKNAELDSFYDKAQSKQQAAVTGGTPEAVVKAQRDAIANTLYSALDPENFGNGPRQIQSRIGAVKEILDTAEKRRNAVLKEQPLTPAGSFGRMAAAIADIPGKVLQGESEKALEAVKAARRGTIDPLIQDAFKNIPTPGALPLPGGTIKLPLSDYLR
jgi:hypothetical protein